MLHGGGQNRFSWKNTGQVLANEGFHVVAIDARGHGDSDRAPAADYAVETLTADVMHVLDAIGRPVVLIGASMGGLTGILVAERAGPEKVTQACRIFSPRCPTQSSSNCPTPGTRRRATTTMPSAKPWWLSSSADSHWRTY
jgi:pimeloyl-ACP methyl ester carboxylesterase